MRSQELDQGILTALRCDMDCGLAIQVERVDVDSMLEAELNRFNR